MDLHYNTETLIDYVHGALDPQTDAAVFTHLSSCGQCRAAYQTEVELGETLRRAARESELEMPTDLVARIRMATRAEAPRGIAAWLSVRRAAWALPAAAALALALWYGGNELRSSGTPAASIDALYYLEAHDAQTRSITTGERSGIVAFGGGTAARAHIDPAFVRATDAYLGETAPGLGDGG